MVETFLTTLYICSCGYKTAYNSNAIRHGKIKSTCEIKSKHLRAISYDDYLAEMKSSNNTNNGNISAHNVTIGDVNNYNIIVPDESLAKRLVAALERGKEAFGSSYVSPDKITEIPGMLLFSASKPQNGTPGNFTQQGNHVIEHFPDGSTKKLPRKKAVKKYLSDMVTQLSADPFENATINGFFNVPREFGKNEKRAMHEIVATHDVDSVAYHRKAGEYEKQYVRKMADHLSRFLDDSIDKNSKFDPTIVKNEK
jgi:hypothetical protein